MRTNKELGVDKAYWFVGVRSPGIMRQPPRSSIRRGTVFFIGFILLIPSLTSSAGPAATSESQSHPLGTSACATVLAQMPTVNSSLFQKVCTEPSFAAALQMWGVANFTFGSASSAGYETLYYGFFWSAPCSNPNSTGSVCSEQEYWTGNVTTQTVTGPFFKETPFICMCGAVLARPPPSPPTVALLTWVPALGLLAGAALAIGVSIRRRRRPPSPVQTP